MRVRIFRPVVLAVLGMAFLLGGCATTRFSAQADLTDRLAGRYWFVYDADLDSGYSFFAVDVKRQPHDRFRIRIRESDTQDLLLGEEFPIVRGIEPVPGKLLALWSDEPDAEGIMVLLPSDAGTWLVGFGLCGWDDLQDDMRETWLEEKARQHGLEFSNEGDCGVVAKPGDEAKVMAFLSDPLVLGAIRFGEDSIRRMYPADGRPLPKPDEAMASDDGCYSAGLWSAPFPLDPASLAHVDGLEGRYVGRFDHGSTYFDSESGKRIVIPDTYTRVTAGEDGGYVITAGENAPSRFWVMNAGDDLLGIFAQTGYESERTFPIYRYILLERAADGSLNRHPLMPKCQGYSRAIDGAAAQLRESAARRHGLSIGEDPAGNGSKLDGPLDSARLVALLADPQFRAGLDGDSPSIMEPDLERVENGE